MSTTRKRKGEEAGLDSSGASSQSNKKVFPIFARHSEELSKTPSPFNWKKLPYTSSTCLFGECLSPKLRNKIAAFDLDGTVLKWPPPKIETNWEYWHRSVPKYLKEAHDSGHTLVFFSNQSLRGDEKLAAWKRKIAHMARALGDLEVPFLFFAATAKDEYRKPMPGMWLALERFAADSDGVNIDLKESFFVGDAAGRAKDFAGTDRKFAENIGIRFHTPEEYFFKHRAEPYVLKGNRIPAQPRDDVPTVTPTSSPVLPTKADHTEIILFVGFPASGKSTFYEGTFKPAGYKHVNQDTLGSRQKCLKAAEESLTNKASCVIDNTNRDKKTREHYIQLARKLNVPIRCFKFEASRELAWHNNIYRTYSSRLMEDKPNSKLARLLIPYSAFASFEADYEDPTVEEGFSEVRTVHWKFSGNAEQERFWNMWLQVDGK